MPVLSPLSKAILILFALQGSVFAKQVNSLVGDETVVYSSLSNKPLGARSNKPLGARANNPLSARAIVDIVLELGYCDINEIEISDDYTVYEVDAYTKDRQKVEIEIDAFTGDILEVDEF